MKIKRATINELEPAAELLDLYRQFYQQESNLDGARAYIKERMLKEESVIFIAYNGNDAVGFVQLYPSFSSVSMKRLWVLNDLYVKKQARGKGIGEHLIQQAINLAAETGAKGVLLETARDNLPAQKLYEKIGFLQESNYFYFYSIANSR